MKAPAGALFCRGDQWNAYVVAQGHPRLRPVKIARSSGVETEILEGLKDGDEAILYPGGRVKEGLRIAVVKL